MIYVYPVGGLGNMFFQIASIWTLAKDNDDDLCLLNIDHKIRELDSVSNVTDTWHITKHSIKYRYFLDRFHQRNANIPIQMYYPFYYSVLTYKNECQYSGYFQSEKYFKHKRKEIIELFKPDDNFINDINKYSNLFDNISLHIRRSWINLGISNIHTVQSMDYYNTAISMLPNDKKILVFSDDLEWCKQNFIGNRFVFVDEIDYISIYIMSKMKYHIIANSTFSWWGAWLSDSEKIIAPKKWFGTDIPDADIIPENWIRI